MVRQVGTDLPVPGVGLDHRSDLELTGRPGLLERVVLEGDTRKQRVTISPFPRPGHHATWEPHRQVVTTDEGALVAERDDPAAAFAGATRGSAWDEFQVAYFASEANWNYVTAPFLFARPDFVTEETWPWREDRQTWRTLLVTYPDTLVAHTQQQTCYIDDDRAARRLDYSVDILGGCPRCTIRRGTASSTGSWSRPIAGCTSARPTASRSVNSVRSPSTSPMSGSVEFPVNVREAPPRRAKCPGGRHQDQ